LESPLSIFDHIPQADCLLPQESFGIENDVLGDDDHHTFTFNDLICLTPNFANIVSIKIGTDFIQISRRKTLKLPEKRPDKSCQDGSGLAQKEESTHGAQLPAHALNDAIPREKGMYLLKESGHELRLETKSWLGKNIKLKCDRDHRRLLIEAEIATQADHQGLISNGNALKSGLSVEEYLSKILVVALMGLCDKDDTIRTESQCLLCCIFRRLGSGPAFEHTKFSCPPSNMNRLLSETSISIVESNPRLALPFLEYSFSIIVKFSKTTATPPVKLQ
jgi:hypothetical protein